MVEGARAILIAALTQIFSTFAHWLRQLGSSVYSFWQHLSFTDQWTVIIITPLTVACAWYAYATYRDSRRVAEASGVFRKARVRMHLCGIALDDDPQIDLWCFVHPGGFGDVAIFPMPFCIENQGDGALSDAIFTFEAGGESIIEEAVPGSVRPAVMADEVKRAVVSVTEAIHEVSHRIPMIGPKGGGLIEELLRLEPTIDYPSSTKATTKDGIGIVVNFTFDIVVLCKVRVFNADLDQQHSFTVAALRGNSIEDARARMHEKITTSHAKYKHVIFIRPTAVERTLQHGNKKGYIFKSQGTLELLKVRWA
jgi:hypothetical protein